LKVALSCITHGQLTVSPTGYSNTDREHSWSLNRLAGAALDGTGIQLKASMRYRIIRTEPGSDEPWRVTTRGYMYTLERRARGDEIVAWHWHPTSNYAGPHLHVGNEQLGEGAALTSRSHISTSRVAFESVVRTAVELGATPMRSDWEDRLRISHDIFELYRTWGTVPPDQRPPEPSGRHRRT
jgi:hypothetical protein